jgi:hypothetical protein
VPGLEPCVGIGGVGNKKCHLNIITSTSDGMERQVFPAADNRCQQSRKSHDRLSCGPDQSQDGYLKLYPYDLCAVLRL